ncbi:MAG: ParB/RepB/Spo0J family partition protein [Patescibacteria group bacterium]
MNDLQVINSVFNIEIEKIDPNPNQPRKHFSDESLRDLAESIRRYGVMQPITVVRREQETAGGGIITRYEIVAGERRWRASVIAGMSTIPAIIREDADSEQERFELSVLENLQREDLNPVDRARSFERLVNEFGMRHAEIADRLGKSREYVTNSMRILDLPDNVLDALSAGEIYEGHTRPMLSIKDHPEELQVLFQEIKAKHLTVRQAETMAKALVGKGPKPSRGSSSVKQDQYARDPEILALQAKLSDTFGTKVSIDAKDDGGKLTIDFFSRDDLKKILDLVGTNTSSQYSANNNQSSSQDSRQEVPPKGELDVDNDFQIIPRPSHQAFYTSKAYSDENKSITDSPFSSNDAREGKKDIFDDMPLGNERHIHFDGENLTKPFPQEPAFSAREENPIEEKILNNQENIDAHQVENHIPDVKSKPVGQLGDEFVPQVAPKGIGAELDSSVSFGEDFIPRNSQSQENDHTQPISRDAKITMGGMGMGDHLGIDTRQRATPSAPIDDAYIKSLHSQDDDDPYRLDNFSI